MYRTPLLVISNEGSNGAALSLTVMCQLLNDCPALRIPQHINLREVQIIQYPHASGGKC